MTQLIHKVTQATPIVVIPTFRLIPSGAKCEMATILTLAVLFSRERNLDAGKIKTIIVGQNYK